MRAFLACCLLLAVVGCSETETPLSQNESFDETQWDMNAEGGEPTLKDPGP